MPIKVQSIFGNSASYKKKSLVIDEFGSIKIPSYELWYQLREFVTHKQIYGLDALSCAQFTHRRIVSNEKTGIKELERKEVYRRRMGAISGVLGRSPDEADAAALALLSAATHYGFYPGQNKPLKKYESDIDRAATLAFTAHKKTLELQYKGGSFIPVLKADYSKGLSSLVGKKGY